MRRESWDRRALFLEVGKRRNLREYGLGGFKGNDTNQLDHQQGTSESENS